MTSKKLYINKTPKKTNISKAVNNLYQKKKYQYNGNCQQ